jgi:hypothetical protein
VVDLGELVVLVAPRSEVDEDAAAGQGLGHHRNAEVGRDGDAEDRGLDHVVA